MSQTSLSSTSSTTRSKGKNKKSENGLESGGGKKRKMFESKCPEIIREWSVVKSVIETNLLREAAKEVSSQESGADLNSHIPNGFQLVRTIGHSKMGIRSALHIPGRRELFAILDGKVAQTWHNESSISKISVAKTRSREPPPFSIPGLEHWIYVDKWKVIVATTNHLQLKVTLRALNYSNAIDYWC